MREMNDDRRHEIRGDPVDQLTTMTYERADLDLGRKSCKG
jgi:hypothetical protein